MKKNDKEFDLFGVEKIEPTEEQYIFYQHKLYMIKEEERKNLFENLERKKHEKDLKRKSLFYFKIDDLKNNNYVNEKGV